MSKYINGLLQMSAVSVVMMSAIFAEQTSMSNPPAQTCQMGNMCSNYPMLNNGYDVHMDIGYLLEQFVLTGTDFSFTNEGIYDSLPASVKMKRPQFNVASGLTAELGYFFKHDNWFLNTRFDWVSRKGHGNWSADNSVASVVPTGVWLQADPADVSYFQEVDSSLKVSYYNLQMDLNRGSFVTKNLAVEPHVGLKAAFIYYTGHQEFEGDQTIFNLEREQSTQFWGLGPDFGMNTQWNFCNNFSMYCDTTVALLCGGVRVSDEVEFNGVESDINGTYATANPIVMSPTVRAVLGLQYNTGIFDNSQNVRFRIGLDSAYYWNQFQHINAGDAEDYSTFNFADNGGFGMMGMIVELGWDF